MTTLLTRKLVAAMIILVALFSFNLTTAQSCIIGTGTTTSNGSNADPVERYYNYEHTQIVYLASELSAGGMSAGSNITAMGFSISESASSLANYEISMGHTSQTLANPMVSTGLTVVRNAATYSPVVQTAGNFDMITFDTPFAWDGTSNIVINICTGSNPFASPYGGLRYTSATSGAMRIYRLDGSSNCSNFTSGTNYSYRPNIKFDFNSGPCTGTPAPGNTLASANPTCGATTLSLQNNTTGSGVTYQWYSSPDGVSYSPISGANSPSYAATQTASTYYYCDVTCSGNTGSSTPLQVTQNPYYNCYCVPVTTSGCTDGDVIAQVILNTLNNNSGTGCPSGLLGYSDYTGDPLLTTNLTAGNTYNCQVWAGQYTESYAAWIDYNDNGVFEHPGERIGFTASPVAGSGSVGVLGSSATFPITLACNPPSGPHRLRVRAMYSIAGSAMTPCGNNTFGETEDYLITIDPPLPCPAPSSFALTSGSETSTGATFSWTNGCTETNWQIEFGPTGFTPGTGTVEAVSSNPATTTTMPCGTTLDVYLRADCGGNGTSTYVGPISVTTGVCPCSGTPNSTTASASNETVCAGISSVLSITSPGPESGYTYQWEESADDITYNPISGATTASYTVTPLANTYYHCIVTCSNSGLSAPSSSTFVAVDNSVNGGVISGPSTGFVGQSLSFSVSGTLGDLQWQTASSINGTYSDVSGATTASTSITPSAAGNLYIRVMATSPTCTTYSAPVLVSVTLANDDICNAAPITLGVSGTYSNVGATVQPGEAAPPTGSCTGQATWCSGQVPNNTVWFSFVAPASGKVSINVLPANWDSEIALWQASSCSDLTSGGGTLVAANDDITGSSPYHAAIASACVVPGQTYYVQVDGFGTTTNSAFQLELIEESNPAPSVLCYETASWNAATCTWDVTGTQPAMPTLACYETASFNYTTCVWDVTGSMPAMPTLACYETASFNGTTCVWDVTGSMPAMPNLACYETASFNGTTCVWDVTGSMPAMPNLACYETASFNGTTCIWDVTGSMPAMPNLACYETASFNGTTCVWDVTGSPNPPIVTTISACVTYNWPITGSNYTATGVYTANVGCQDYTLNLTINPLPTVTASDVSACAGNSVGLIGNPSGGSFSVSNPYSGPTTTYTYTYTDGNGCTNTSAPANIFMTAAPPVTGINMSNIGGNSATVNWNGIPGLVWYEVRYRAVGAGSWTGGGTQAAPTTYKNIVGLTAGTQYEVEVRGFCSTPNFPGPWSATSIFTTSNACVAPSNLAEINVTGTTTTLTWTAVPNTNYYQVRYRLAAGPGAWVNGTAPGTATSKNYTGLALNTAYEWQIRAICNPSPFTTGPWSELGDWTTLASKPSVEELVSLQNEIMVYPNPATSVVMVDITAADAQQTVVKLFDISGRLVKQMQARHEAGSHTMTLGLEELTSGMYTIQVYSNDALKHTSKISKQD